MDKYKDILEWVGYILAFIGFCATVYKTINVWINIKNLSWAEVEKYSKKIIKEISKVYYIPDIIIGIGRGGAILGALLSGNIVVPTNQKLRNISLLSVERVYEWEHGERFEIDNNVFDFSPLKGKKVLLVAGDLLTGETMKFFIQKLEQSKVAEIKTACVLKGVASTFEPDFFGKEITSNFSLPWMFKGYNYLRDSRKPVRTNKK